MTYDNGWTEMCIIFPTKPVEMKLPSGIKFDILFNFTQRILERNWTFEKFWLIVLIIARREIQIVDARRRQKQKKGVRCFELFGFHKWRFEAPFWPQNWNCSYSEVQANYEKRLISLNSTQNFIEETFHQLL